MPQRDHAAALENLIYYIPDSRAPISVATTGRACGGASPFQWSACALIASPNYHAFLEARRVALSDVWGATDELGAAELVEAGPGRDPLHIGSVGRGGR